MYLCKRYCALTIFHVIFRMEELPIFNGSAVELVSWLTKIDEYAQRNQLNEVELKELCLSKILSEKAVEIFKKNYILPWNDLKNELIKDFSVKLSIREKVEIRKALQQKNRESVDEFYSRCVQAQYLVSDYIRDVTFDREVLLHFLIGLLPSIRDLVLATKCSNPDEYIREATHFLNRDKLSLRQVMTDLILSEYV